MQFLESDWSGTVEQNGKILTASASNNTNADAKEATGIRLEKGVFTVTPAPEYRNQEVSFTIGRLQAQEQLAARSSLSLRPKKTTCDEFKDVAECANDAAFCRLNCQLLVCQAVATPAGSALPYETLVASEATDAEVLAKC